MNVFTKELTSLENMCPLNISLSEWVSEWSRLVVSNISLELLKFWRKAIHKWQFGKVRPAKNQQRQTFQKTMM